MKDKARQVNHTRIESGKTSVPLFPSPRAGSLQTFAEAGQTARWRADRASESGQAGLEAEALPAAPGAAQRRAQALPAPQSGRRLTRRRVPVQPERHLLGAGRRPVWLQKKTTLKGAKDRPSRPESPRWLRRRPSTGGPAPLCSNRLSLGSRGGEQSKITVFETSREQEEAHH